MVEQQPGFNIREDQPHVLQYGPVFGAGELNNHATTSGLAVGCCYAVSNGGTLFNADGTPVACDEDEVYTYASIENGTSVYAFQDITTNMLVIVADAITTRTSGIWMEDEV